MGRDSWAVGRGRGGIQNSEFGIQNGGTTGGDHEWAQMVTNFWGAGRMGE